MILTERQLVSSLLKVKERKPFAHPNESPVPTVDITTRFPLESIRDIKLDGYHPGLSSEAKKLLLDVFKLIVRERKYTAAFPMSKLHGFSANKSSMSTRRARVLQLTMAGMGSLVDDLRDLVGLEGSQIINACMAWPELRINQGIRLYTDNWHQRFYWGNSGGSHHMVVLCFQLQELGREWRPVVEIHEEILDLLPLCQLSANVSVFVVMDDNHRQGTLFERLPGNMQYGDIQQKLGVTWVHFGSKWASNQYLLFLVDHSREYSDLSLVRLNALVDTGHAMRFQDFLLAWKGHGAPEKVPLIVTAIPQVERSVRKK